MSTVDDAKELAKTLDGLVRQITEALQKEASDDRKHALKRIHERASSYCSWAEAKASRLEELADFDPLRKKPEWEEHAQELAQRRREIEDNVSVPLRELGIEVAPPRSPQPPQAEKPSPFRPSPSQSAPRDPDLAIAQELHWDRDHVVDTFVNMIRQSSKYSYRVLGIQGPKAAGLPSLVKRLQEMCDKTTGLSRPLLWATITLKPTLASPNSLAREILTQLHSKAAYNKQPDVRLQATTLMGHCKKIERSEGSEALAKERPSPYELAYDLTNNLREVAQSCTVVLLLEQFDQLCDSDSGKWLMDEWLLKNASQVESGLVIVITGERGLDNLEGDGIHCFPSLTTMSVEDFKSWADCVLAFDPMSLVEIQVLHDKMKADVEEFRRYLFWARLLQ